VVIGRARLSIGAGKSKKVKVRISRNGRRRILRRRRRRCHVSVVTRAGGRRRVTRLSITIRAPKKRRRKTK
jgi:hypothetical protein